MLLNITGSAENLSMFEVNEASVTIQEAANVDANIIFGASLDDSLGDTVRVTVIATGFDEDQTAVGRQETVAAAPAAKPMADQGMPKPDFFKVNNIDIPVWMKKNNE